MPTENPTWSFALVVVRRDDEFLVVHDPRADADWSLPGGQVEPGEELAEAALRQTLETTGERVALTGVLRIEHSPLASHDEMRAIFTAAPAHEIVDESELVPAALDARWVSLSDLDLLPLRSDEMRDIFEYVARNQSAPFPIALLAREGVDGTGGWTGAWTPWTPREVV